MSPNQGPFEPLRHMESQYGVTVSPRLTQERLELLRLAVEDVRRWGDKASRGGKLQRAQGLYDAAVRFEEAVPHLGEQEAPLRECGMTQAHGPHPWRDGDYGGDYRCPGASAGSSAVPRCPECGRQMSADGEGWFVCAHNHPAIYCEEASHPAVSGPPCKACSDNGQLIAALQETLHRIERYAKWGRNLPGHTDLEVARREIQRPEIREAIDRLNADAAQASQEETR